MKNLIFFAAAMLILGISSCSKDDDNGSQGNFLTIGTEAHTLDRGFLEGYGQVTSEPGFNLDLTLLGGLTYDPLSEDFTGEGEVIYFELLSPTDGELATGTYVFDVNFDQNFTYDECSIGEDFDSVTETGSITGSNDIELKVSKSGSIYTIEFSGNTFSNRAVSGRFVGTLPIY